MCQSKMRHVLETTLFGVDEDYLVNLRQDQDTGVIHSGVCGQHVEAHTISQALHALQKIVDAQCDRQPRTFWFTDPGVESPELRSLLIYARRGNNRLYSIDGGLPSWRTLPKRWVIRANKTPITVALTHLGDCVQEVQRAEQELEDLTNDNPSL